MDRREIITKIIQTVTQVQEASGRATNDIDESTRPIGGVEGFDSLCGVEATVMLAESLGIDIPDSDNPFISTDGKRALSVGAIADNLISTYIVSEA